MSQATTNQTETNQTTLNIKQWGNSLGMRLPSVLAKKANLRLNQRVSLRLENGKIIISPITINPSSLEAKLAEFDPSIHNGETMQTNKLLGAEKI